MPQEFRDETVRNGKRYKDKTLFPPLSSKYWADFILQKALNGGTTFFLANLSKDVLKLELMIRLRK